MLALVFDGLQYRGMDNANREGQNMSINAKDSQAFPGWRIEDLGSGDRAYVADGPYWVASGIDDDMRWARVMDADHGNDGPVLYGVAGVVAAIERAERMNDEAAR